MPLHIKTTIRVNLDEGLGGPRNITLRAEGDGLPPKRWTYIGPVDESDIANAVTLAGILKEELRSLTLDEYARIPVFNRAQTVTDLVLNVSNIRARAKGEL